MKKFLTKEYWTFWRIFWWWIAVVCAGSLLDVLLFHAPWYVDSLLRAGMGITYLLYPAYPANWEWPAKRKKAWSPAKCRLVLRIVAVLEILLSFCVQITA